jgi:hypothetical protein
MLLVQLAKCRTTLELHPFQLQIALGATWRLSQQVIIIIIIILLLLLFSRDIHSCLSFRIVFTTNISHIIIYIYPTSLRQVNGVLRGTPREGGLGWRSLAF